MGNVRVYFSDDATFTNLENIVISPGMDHVVACLVDNMWRYSPKQYEVGDFITIRKATNSTIFEARGIETGSKITDVKIMDRSDYDKIIKERHYTGFDHNKPAFTKMLRTYFQNLEFAKRIKEAHP